MAGQLQFDRASPKLGAKKVDPTKSEQRKLIILATLAASPARALGPVQIQKALFLMDKRIPKLVNGPLFAFRPYHYGPFDSRVYRVLEDLEKDGLVQIQQDLSLRRNDYRLMPRGISVGEEQLKKMNQPAAKFIRTVAQFVSGVSFAELVSSIYREYPEMKVNSVFAG